MAAIKQLAAVTRSGIGKGAARSVRREGRVPGVVYGGGEAAELSLDVLHVVARDAHRAPAFREVGNHCEEGLLGGGVAVEFEVEIHRVQDGDGATGELGVGLRKGFRADVQRQAGGDDVFFCDDVAFHVRRGKLGSIVTVHRKAAKNELGLAPSH